MEQSGTVEKALDVLFHLHEAAQPRGVTAIARCLGLPKSSVHRLLAALGRRGLVEQDAEGRYRLGFGLVALGLGMLEREPIVLAARPVLEVAAKALAETLFLTAAREGEITVLDKVEGPGLSARCAAHRRKGPLARHGGGKAPPRLCARRRRAPRRPPSQLYAAHADTARCRAASEVALARRRGWAENREEWIPGLVVVAAPVLVGGRLVATVALAAPTVRLAARESGRVAQQLLAAAGHISDRLQGRGERRTA